MIGRRISHPKGITQAQSRAQLHLFLARAHSLDNVDVAALERRYNVPRLEIQQALAAAQQVRGQLL